MTYRDDESVEDTTEFEPARYIALERGGKRNAAVPAVGETDATAAEVVEPRQPHLGYSLLTLAIGLVAMIVCTGLVLFAAWKLHYIPSLAHLDPARLPKTSILGEALGYGVAVAVLVPLFTRMWGRPFAQVLRMQWEVARANLGKLVLFGVVLSVAAQAAESLLTLPKDVPLDAFFRTPSDVWMVAVFGTLIAPPIEELLFRGFLLPAFAIAFDWLRVPRDEAGRAAWRSTDSLSRAGLVFSGILTSVLFGVMHAAQLGFAWNAVALLTCVGGVLAVVRLRFGSVWASSVVHMVYNGFIFVLLFAGTDGFRHLEKLHGH